MPFSSSSTSSSKKSKKVKDSDNEDDDDGGSTDSEGSTKAQDVRNTLPDLSNARPNALKGLKVVFVGNCKSNDTRLNTSPSLVEACRTSTNCILSCQSKSFAR